MAFLKNSHVSSAGSLAHHNAAILHVGKNKAKVQIVQKLNWDDGILGKAIQIRWCSEEEAALFYGRRQLSLLFGHTFTTNKNVFG